MNPKKQIYGREKPNGNRTFYKRKTFVLSPFLNLKKILRRHRAKTTNKVKKTVFLQISHLLHEDNHRLLYVHFFCLVSTPRITLGRIVHVKDDYEQSNVDENRLALSMSEAANEMSSENCLKPRIILERIYLGRF